MLLKLQFANFQNITGIITKLENFVYLKNQSFQLIFEYNTLFLYLKNYSLNVQASYCAKLQMYI